MSGNSKGIAIQDKQAMANHRQTIDRPEETKDRSVFIKL